MGYAFNIPAACHTQSIHLIMNDSSIDGTAHNRILGEMSFVQSLLDFLMAKILCPIIRKHNLITTSLLLPVGILKHKH